MGRRLSFLHAFVLAALLAAVLVPGTALGAGVNVPPGNGEADQYSETIPDGQGNSTPDSTRQPSDVLTPAQAAALAALGPEGDATASFAAASAPAQSLRGGSGSGAGSAAGGDAGDGGAVATQAVVPERDSLGGFLWVLIIGGAVGSLIYAAVRRQARRGS